MARGSVAALAATATAAASHTLAGANAPPPAILALAATFAVVVCVFLSGRRLALPRLTASVLLSQLAYHALFLVAGSGGVSVVGTSGGGVHAHDGSTVSLVVLGGGHAAHGPAMLIAHFAAAVLTIAMLRHGEQIFWTLGAELERVVVHIVAWVSALITPRSPSVAVVGAPTPRTPRRLNTVLSVLRHRGPPARVMCAV
ncbi:hypothetical protein [Rathayibacter iranicus]|uniref:Integral membrane protein n=2 Tax=Rathayibacter iranicus TaxID=59737 RepID=A0AAD1ADF9_9MICO|nr:hypothetical protein [Rathayibacter iranicus]AZZ56198.1 hypothetical protein C7V51_10100 [Rathayibacter iranicus]MWV30101.1 hypothetical protein [Rathayibacter iranicus NCPPB 2253 = VKM Ac-1602]PPI59640.1 hypothetical protein C5E08_10015 [Rathayibacter iranicus]PWJ65288.1 hypothetical protein B0H03_103135 [Rathayibacter iranicus NCPPB 2253 = VKM Ac-1602]